MITRLPPDLVKTLTILGLMGLALLALQAIAILFHGRVCNHSSINIWLTLTESGRQKAYALAAGECTDFLTQDAEAIWGSDCNGTSCKYQAWKIRAGHFEIQNDGNPPSNTVLRIQGWGAGSRWQISEDWPKPDLSAIRYLLTR